MAHPQPVASIQSNSFISRYVAWPLILSDENEVLRLILVMRTKYYDRTVAFISSVLKNPICSIIEIA